MQLYYIYCANYTYVEICAISDLYKKVKITNLKNETNEDDDDILFETEEGSVQTEVIEVVSIDG